MNYTEYGQPWQAKQTQTHRLPVRSNSEFIYKHHPANWELCKFETKKGKTTGETWVWLPQLHQQKLTPGTNGTQVNGNKIDSTLAKAMAVDNGFTIIEPQEYDYMRVYPAHKGNFHVDRFTKIEKMGRRIIQTFDHQEYNDFRLRLMQDGKIRIPHQVLIKEIIIETQKRITRQDNKSHLPERQIKIKAMKTKVTNMKKAAAELETKGKKVYEIG